MCIRIHPLPRTCLSVDIAWRGGCEASRNARHHRGAKLWAPGALHRAHDGGGALARERRPGWPQGLLEEGILKWNLCSPVCSRTQGVADVASRSGGSIILRKIMRSKFKSLNSLIKFNIIYILTFTRPMGAAVALNWQFTHRTFLLSSRMRHTVRRIVT